LTHFLHETNTVSACSITLNTSLDNRVRNLQFSCGDGRGKQSAVAQETEKLRVVFGFCVDFVWCCVAPSVCGFVCFLHVSAFPRDANIPIFTVVGINHREFKSLKITDSFIADKEQEVVSGLLLLPATSHFPIGIFYLLIHV
jgi:hypothetical protein